MTVQPLGEEPRITLQPDGEEPRMTSYPDGLEPRGVLLLVEEGIPLIVTVSRVDCKFEA